MKLPFNQIILSKVCKALAGDEFEERATNLLPENKRIRGLRLRTYRLFSKLRYWNAIRISRKFNTHIFTA